MRLSIAVAALTLAACSHVPTLRFSCPGGGGPEWREVTTAHVTLYTDLSSGRAATLASELEEMRAMVVAALFRNPPSLPGRIEVIAFRNEYEYEEFAPLQILAFYALTPDGDDFLVVHGKTAWDKTRTVLAHEITHHVLAQVFARQPRWFAEGMATFLETLGAEGLGAKRTVGEIPESRGWSRAPVGPILRGEERIISPYAYETSWLLVHWLFNRHPREFGELQQRFARAEDPVAAWRATFPSFDPDDPAGVERLEKALKEHITERRGVVREIRVDAVAPPAERVIPPAEVHALRLRLWPLRWKPDVDGAALRGEIAEALTEDPTHPVALRSRAGDAAPPVDAARASVAAHPADWRAHALLADALVGPDGAAERLSARRRAVELAPAEPRALRGLALELVAAGQPDEAVTVALQAARLGPSTPRNHLALATALTEAHRCGDVHTAARRSVDVLTERAPEKYRRSITDEADTLERRCRREAGAAAAP